MQLLHCINVGCYNLSGVVVVTILVDGLEVLHVVMCHSFMPNILKYIIQFQQSLYVNYWVALVPASAQCLWALVQ